MRARDRLPRAADVTPRARDDIPQELRHVYWIGGGSGAGKSAVAARLASEHDLLVYDTDDAMADHARRTDADHSPQLARFAAMDMDERWARRSPATMLDTFHWFRGEAFDLIVDDLLALPSHRSIVVEGFRLLPHLVQPLLADPSRAVWLLPTPEFRITAFERRGSLRTIAEKTSDPERALHNLLARDALFTDRLRAETTRLGLAAITVDGTMTEGQLTDWVAASLGL